MKRHREKVDKGWRDRYEQVGREISAHDVVRLVSGFPISRDQCSSTIWHSFSQLCFAVSRVPRIQSFVQTGFLHPCFSFKQAHLW